LPDNPETHRWRRIFLLIAAALLLEAVLFAIARISPAMAGLMRSAYIVVGLLAVIVIVHASRRREGSDRRQDERRDPSPNDSTV
jgi:uncharacterized membrane protein YuzA (DUF378 family)